MPRRRSGAPLISPSGVRYIKQGEAGGWEKTAIAQNICLIGFGSQDAARFRLCVIGDWKAVNETFVSNGRKKATATSFTNQLRRFYEDDGSTLWMTFVGERLYWGFLDGPPRREPELEGSSRTIKGGWSCTDVNGE